MISLQEPCIQSLTITGALILLMFLFSWDERVKTWITMKYKLCNTWDGKKKIRIFLFSGLLGYSLRFAPFSIYLFYLSLLSRRNLKSVKACRSPAGQRARKGGKKRKERRMKDQDITNANMSAGWYYIVQINPEGNGQCMHTVGVIVIFSDNWW